MRAQPGAGGGEADHADAPVLVRPVTAGDAARIAEVHRESILTLGVASYPPEVVEEWAALCRPERYLANLARGELFWLAINADGAAVGFCGYRVEAGRHRTALYVAGRAARRGVGTALFSAAEAAARAAGALEVHVDASVGSTGFYRAMGFDELGSGRHPLPSGRDMACVFMRKRLR